MNSAQRMQQRLDRLQAHLKEENPVLVEVVDRYRQLDKIAIKLGLLQPGESYATRISWWPLISVLGTFSAGKSSFINSYLGVKLQESGNQAVDDRFTVISFSSDENSRTLPGLALDGDPRFPFYQVSEDIERVSEGEGSKIDNYLQMKVVPSDKLRGKMLIDSPGFDADEQRKSTLRITDHIIDLSDLVLVFFDGRHPEPGAMQDTLEHLVKGSQRRNDSNKFLFILNQIDTAAREDNLESIVAAWQKALVQSGLTAGRFYCIYNEDLAEPVANEAVWQRYQNKRSNDYDEISKRMEDINIERIYRLIGNIESLSNQIEQQAIPQIRLARQAWRRRVLLVDALLALLVLAGAGLLIWRTDGLSRWFEDPTSIVSNTPLLVGIGLILLLAVVVHYLVRGILARRIARSLPTEEVYGNVSQAFRSGTRVWNSIFSSRPRGWRRRVSGKLSALRNDVDLFVQRLNDNFSSPSGEQ